MRGYVRRREDLRARGKRGPRWQAVLELGSGRNDRRRRTRVFDSKTEADAWIAEQIRRGDPWAEPGRVTVGEYLETWIAARRGEIRHGTAEWYASRIRCELVPNIGGIRLRDLTRERIRRMYAELPPGKADRAHRTLRKALEDAVESGLLARNPASGARRGATERSRPRAGTMRVWGWDELERFLEVAGADPLFAYWRLLAATGCRRGEGLGIFWPDVDLEAAAVTFQRGRTDAGWEPPKTNSGRRTVDLDPATVDALRGWRSTQMSERLAAGPVWHERLDVAGSMVPNDLVFTRPTGTPWTPGKVTGRFKELVELAGVRRIRLHDLRHTHATLLLKAGINPRVVQERLGHSRVSTTLDLYGHVLPSMGRDAARVFGEELDAARGRLEETVRELRPRPRSAPERSGGASVAQEPAP